VFSIVLFLDLMTSTADFLCEYLEDLKNFRKLEYLNVREGDVREKKSRERCR
jgi:hypothetical protein